MCYSRPSVALSVSSGYSFRRFGFDRHWIVLQKCEEESGIDRFLKCVVICVVLE